MVYEDAELAAVESTLTSLEILAAINCGGI